MAVGLHLSSSLLNKRKAWVFLPGLSQVNLKFKRWLIDRKDLRSNDSFEHSLSSLLTGS